MRLKSALLVAALALATVTAPLTANAGVEDPVWTFTGAGWGHGVGMSQYGAYGMALDGATAAEIIDHYYSGAYLDDLENRTLPSWWDDPYPLLVGLEQNVNSVTFVAVGGSVDVCHFTDDTKPCDSQQVAAGAPIFVEGDGENCSVVVGSGAPRDGTCMIDLTWAQDAGVLVSVNGARYARGSLTVRPDGSGELNVVLEVALELYLRGIAEMPGDWPPAALEAQAIAARNYAVRRVIDTSTSSGQPTRSCGCHVYDSVYDQVYGGWDKEIAAPYWVSAVDLTAGTVAVHKSTGLVFTAYYSSSSGGATENNETVWGGSPIGYLRSVSDGWAVSDKVSNPYAQWAATFTSSKVESILGWDEVLDIELIHQPPGAIVRFTGIDGGSPVTRDYQGDTLRTTFDLRSPWVAGVISPFDFRDVAGSVHQEGIAYISDLGITKGCNPPTNDMFCPDDTVTRGQMAAFMVRALHLPAAPGGGFTDTSDSIFSQDIDQLVSAGVTKGCNPPSNDRYCPDSSVTRGEMAAFLVRAFRFSDVGVTAFVDDDGSVFEADIQRLATAGVTKGCNPPDNDRFCPDQEITRAEMATFLMRALETLEG